MRQGEIVIALLLIGVSAAIWIGSAGFVPENKYGEHESHARRGLLSPPGCRCHRILFNSAAAARLQGTQQQGPIAWKRWYYVPITFGAMLFQVFTFEELGWMPSVWITLFLLMRLTRVRIWKSIFIPIGFIIFVYLFFVLLLRLQLPTEFLPTLQG